jgi:hypothetical protein
MQSSKFSFVVPALLFAVGCAGTAPSATHAQAQNPAQVCAGLPTEAREVSLFEWDGVSFVEARTEEDPIGRAPRQRTAGARVFVPASQGLTKEYVHRAASCQAAQHAAAAQQSTDPLAVPGVQIRVTSAQNGYLVDLIGDDAATGKELLRRVRSATSSSEVEQLAMSAAAPALF